MKKKFIVMIVAIIIISGFYSITKAENVSDLQAQKEQIKQELNNANESLENIQIELTDALEAISKIEAQIVDGENKLQETTAQIEQLEKEINETQEKLEQAEKNYNSQKEMCEKRLVALYEMGETTYLDVLLNSRSMTDFISNYYLISEIAEYDNELLETIKRQKNKIEEIKNQITQKNENLKVIQESQEKTLIALENSRTIKNSYANSLTEEEQAIQKQIDEYQAKLNNLDTQILFLTQGDGNTEYIGGELAWPAPGYTTITSPFGTRFHPILHVYRTHYGIDIGTPLGASIVAANSGVVTTASYLSSYGNAVIIDHGGGVSTIYAHGSKILTTVGTVVNKGDLIMKAGSTGLSTGPHLHFGVSVNGKYVDPLPYLKGSN